MEIERALDIIRALAEGTNPCTKDSLAADGVFQSADTVRALYKAVEVLEGAQTSQRRPQNVGEPWTQAEDKQLRDEFYNSVDFKDIAKIHCRSRGAIIARLQKMGLVPMSHRTTD